MSRVGRDREDGLHREESPILNMASCACCASQNKQNLSQLSAAEQKIWPPALMLTDRQSQLQRLVYGMASGHPAMPGQQHSETPDIGMAETLGRPELQACFKGWQDNVETAVSL